MTRENDQTVGFGDAEDQRLDDALQMWSDSKSASEVHLQSLQSKILDAQKSELPTGGHSSRNQAVRTGLVLAASVLIALGAVGFWLSSGNQNVIANGSNEELLNNLVGDNFDAQRQLLQHYRELFGSGLGWVSDVEGEMQLGLKPAMEHSANGEFVAVRLALVSRKVSSDAVLSEWSLVRQIDVLARKSEFVELNGVDDALPRLSLWAFPVDRQLVTVDMRIETVSPVPIEFSVSNLLKAGSPEQVYSVQHDGIEYRLYQTATRIVPRDAKVSLLPETNPRERA